MATYRFTLHNTGRSDVELVGNGDDATALDAINHHPPALAGGIMVGRATSAEYRTGILGGKGGYEVVVDVPAGATAHGRTVPSKRITHWLALDS